IAGTYMPGLRLLSDRVSGPQQSRSIAFYTASFGIGTALSLALAGTVAPRAGWKASFLVSAIGPLIAGALVLVLVGPLQRPAAAAGSCSRWRRQARAASCSGYRRAGTGPLSWRCSLHTRCW